MSPETVLRAARLIRTGEIIELGHVLSSTMPLSAGRRFEVDTKRTTMTPESNRRGSNEELVVAEIGQVGTQFDGFAHQTVGNSLYNCFKVDEVSTRTGFTKLGIQNVGALVTRGVLIDVAGLKNVDVLPDTYEIAVQDLQQALAQQKLTPYKQETLSSFTPAGASFGKKTMRGIEGATWYWRRRCGMAASSEPGVAGRIRLPSRSTRTPIRQYRYRFTRSCWSSTAFIC